MKVVVFFTFCFVVILVGSQFLGKNRPPIKGNAPQMIYHLEECPSYFSVIIKPDQGDKLFKTEKEAQDAGFRKANNCP